ncbi:MAG TPA: oligosaccharide flippase family protein [Bryobacteraceae bacterium]|nr:oligosaccharide flippase family protein [Bryobacteraceae bacterium]
MSRSRRFFSGLALSYVYQGLLMLTGLWLTPFLLTHLGQRDYGLWIVGSQLLLYLTLTDFGVVALLPVEVGYATGREGGAARARDLPLVVGQTTRLVLYQLPAVILIAAGLWFAIPAQWQGLRGPLALMLLGFVVSFPLRILPTLVEGLQDLAFANAMRIVNWALNTAAIVALIFAGWNLYALASGWVVCQLVTTPIFLYRLRTRFPEVLPRGLPPLVWEEVRKQLAKGFWVTVAQIASLLVGTTDVLVIARLLGPAAVVPYNCTGKLSGVVGNQVTILMHTAGPGLCELKAGGDRAKIFHVLSALTQGMMHLSGVVFCVVLLLNHWFVAWWVTAHQYGGFFLTVMILINLIVRHWTGIGANTVFFFGHQRRISLTNVTDGVVTAIATFLFVKFWGPVGAVFASLAGAALISLPLNLTVISRDVGVSVWRLVQAMLGAWFWRFALLAGAAAWIAARWSPKTLSEAVLTLLAVTAAYGVVMLPNMFRAPLGNYTRPLLDAFRVRWTAFQVRASS